MKGMTCAGLLNGQGIQSTSHRNGLFTDSVLAFEIVLGDGSVKVCDATHHVDLYCAVIEGSTWGTVGIITAVALKLMPSDQFVVSRYALFTQLDDYVDAYKASLGKSVFHEGIIFSDREYVLITSDFASEAESAPLSDFWYDPWDDAKVTPTVLFRFEIKIVC